MPGNKKIKQLKTVLVGQKRRLIWLAALLLAAACFTAYEIILEDYIPKRFGVVEQRCIYRSGQIDDVIIKKILVKYKIGLIISLSGDSLDNFDAQKEKQAANKLDIERLMIPLSGDGTGDIKNYARAIGAICRAKKEHKRVLVHCASGAQRTGGVIAAYQLLVAKKDAASVLSEMKRYKANVKPDSPLLLYLNRNMKELAELLKQIGVIENTPSPLPQL